MRVIVTLPGIASESAGPSYTVPALARAVQAAGGEVELHTRAPVPDWRWGVPIRTHRQTNVALLQRLGWAPAMLRAFRAKASQTDIIHVNGVWQLPDIYPMRAVRGTACKVVYCPRGGLSQTALKGGNRLLKWFMWHFGGQWRALRETAMFHAASKKEHDEIRALGLTQPIAVIPNGIDVPDVVHRPFEKTSRKLVFFGRIHATKAVDHLVEAWGRVADAFPEWSLEIAGPDCGAVPGLRKIIAERNVPRVTFVGEFNGADKYAFLAQADLYVLPSLTENFGITIAEALACGTPVIASKGCPWEGLVANGCGWWTDIGPAALERQLRETLALAPETLKARGEKGRQWMLEDYLWSGVGRKMLAAYEWLVNGGERPACVHCCD